jgi:DNA repair exonuclease SbcCD ATPase subunit
MAVGVPEADVFAAADRVLQRGDRPTVERVRLELGRGSPARVGQLLDAWWDSLAKRLAGETSLPELPKAAASAFIELWRVATDEARTQLDAAYAERRGALDAEQAQWFAEKAEWAARSERAAAEIERANDARARAESRLEDLQRLLAQHERQLAGDAAQLKALSVQLGELQNERRDLNERLATREAAAIQEREASAAHIRAVEDRAQTEIDRARQEAKSLRGHLAKVERESHQAGEASRQREAELRQSLARAEQSATEHQARAQTLETQLARMDGVGEALRIAQDAVRAGLEREAALRAELSGQTQRRKPAAQAAAGKAAKSPRKSGNNATKPARQ